MSTASLPSSALRGSGGAVLTADEDGLVLDRPGEQITFVSGALTRLRAEGRTLTIQLRARRGATPTEYRVEDVDEAGAAGFAAAVNALLPDRPADDDVDGREMALVRSLVRTSHSRYVRRVMWGALWSFLLLVAATVAVGVAGDAVLVVGTVLGGGLVWLCLCAGVYATGESVREILVRRNGVTTTATPAATFGAYVYRDHHGTYRGFNRGGYDGPWLAVSYPADRPADYLVHQTPFQALTGWILGPFLILCGLAMLVLGTLLLTSALDLV
ncbi:hypothetical protein [Streptomyces sp. NPDC060194]|uniref:hypothetical protein n=1 Tax=Streptomyces sp. NPDC060194 TaxID=3347069 RepID=UPI00364756A8